MQLANWQRKNIINRLSQLIFASLLFLLLGSLAIAPKASAATFNVNTTADTVDAVAGNGLCADSGGVCSLRAAIEEANALAGADTINVVAGTYTLGSNLPAYTQVADLSIIGANAASTIIDGVNSFRAINVYGNAETNLAVIKNLTFRDMSYGSSAITIGCIRANIENLVIEGAKGYGIKLEQQSCAASINSSIKNILVTNAKSGICADDSCRGGIAVFGSTSFMHSFTLEHISIIYTNSTGGAYFTGIRLDQSLNATLTNITIAQNQSDGIMVGIYINSNTSGTVNIINSTIANNTSSGPSGSIFFNSQAAGIESYNNNQINLTNVLLAGNTQNNTMANCDTSTWAQQLLFIDGINSQGGNLSSDTTCSTALNQSSDQNNVNPLLGSLIQSDDFNFVYELLPGSPAINAGVSEGAPNIDQRGIPRPFGSGYDIGAYESTVVTQAGGGNASPSGSSSTLPTVGALWALAVPILLSIMVTMIYIVWDWRRHRRPLILADPHASYSLSHHIAYVTVPTVRFRLGLVPKRMPTIPLHQK